MHCNFFLQRTSEWFLNLRDRIVCKLEDTIFVKSFTRFLMLRILLCLLVFTPTVFAQTYTSTIRGHVKDAITGLPLPGASVTLAPGGEGSIAGADGAFRFENLSMGRYGLTVSFLGYETAAVPEILLESGKENVQVISLHPAGKQLSEATVVSSRPLAFNSVQAITSEQTLRYAATYLDPARVATSFAGVAAANDQANALVIRGNSPNSMQWRLEGVEIVNPNHLSNAGTFSDRPTSTGGGVNIISTQLMGVTNFLTGAFPAQYGNALSGVMDMNLRKGNDEKTEFTAQAGLIGLDFAAEGPFSKNSRASYLFNYRYSFTGLLGAMGVNFGGEDIRFQDLSFNVNLPTAKAGDFTFFAMGGLSSNDFKGEPDSTAWEIQKDGYNIVYKNKMGAAGVTHTLPLGRKASLRTVAAFSGLRTSRDSDPLYDLAITPGQLTDNAVNAQSRVSLNSTLTFRMGDKSRIKAGAFLTFRNDKLNGLYTYGNFNTNIFQPFASWNYQLTPAVTTELGLHAMISSVKVVNGVTHRSLEPRAAIRWQISGQSQLSFSYGLHSQMQLPQLYSAMYSSTGFAGNPKLGPSKAHHYVLGFQQNFRKNSSLKLEAYWQEQYGVPVNERYNFSAINFFEAAVFLPLENIGKGRNYGLEATYQKLLTDQFYMLIAGSVYDATYDLGDGIRLDSRFNGRHTLSFTGGKEVKTKNNSIWGFNTKVLWLGGFRERPINVFGSQGSNATVYQMSGAYTVKMKDYFRPDLRIYRKKSREKYSTTFALDLQNVSGTKNIAYHYYDTVKKSVVNQKQLGLIPVLSYRWEF